MTYTRKDTQMPAPGVRKPAMPQVRPRFAGLYRSAVALFRLGTYRARLAAALMIVAGGLLYQTGAEALEQSSKKVLYLDAPSVSVPQAEKAGETARGYAGPDANVDNAVLAWADVKPVPLEARKAFASITDPSGQPPGGVSYDDAVAAGDAMVAQLGGDSPAGGGGDDELASADPVRPKLGDGTKATDAPEPDGTGQQPGATGTGSQQPEYAAADNPAPSDLGLPAPMAEEYALPAEQTTAEQPPDSSGGEPAVVPEDASEGTGEGTGGTSGTGPISDDYSPEATSSDPSNGSADEAVRDETESGSSDVGEPDAQEDEASPTIMVSDSPAPDDEPEQEYAEVPEGSGTEPETSETETSEPENIGTPPDEPSSDPSSEPSPASTAEEPVPAQDSSPGSDEQEPEESSDLVAVVPYDPGADESQDESQESPEQSSQPPAESFAQPPSDETESGQQGEFPDQAAATPTPAEEESTGEEPDPQSDTQPGTDPNAELGAGEDMGTDDELPEGVQIESSDEAGVQKLSVVVHQESDATDVQAGDSPDAQVTPEPAPSGPKDGEDHPSNGRGQNPNAEPAPQTNDAGQPDPDQANDTPGHRPGDHTARGNNPGDDSPAPQEAPGEQQQPAPQASPGPSAGAERVQPETTPEPTAGNEADEPEAAPADQGRQSNQRPDQERVSKQDPQTTAPAPAPTPTKDQAPRPDTEGASQGAQSNDQVQDPTQSRYAKEGKQQRPQHEQQQSSQPAREPRQEPRQSTAPVEASPEKVSPGQQSDGTGAQGPTQSSDAVQISAQTAPPAEPQAQPQLEPVPAQDYEPPTPAATLNEQHSSQATPAPQVAAGQAAPTVASQTAPTVETSVEPATEEVADPAGWVDPMQAAAARQAARQEWRATRQAQRIAARQANLAASQIPAQPVETATQSYAEPAVDQEWDPASQKTAGSVQDQGTADGGVPVQDYSAQDASTQASEMVAGVNEVDSDIQGTVGTTPEPPIPPENIADPYADPYVEPAPAETYTKPTTQVPARQLEPVQQIPTQELAPAPQVANVLQSEPAAAPPSAAPTGVDADAASPAPAQQAQQQAASTVGTVIQQTMSAGDVTGGGK